MTRRYSWFAIRSMRQSFKRGLTKTDAGKEGIAAVDIVIKEGSATRTVAPDEECTALDLLRENGVYIDAPCGGNGTCGKCRVLVRDDQGLSWRLACETPVSDGMEIVVEQARKMEVSEGGMRHAWLADGKQGEYGIAIDVGTTTVVCRLVDLATGETVATYGRSNPQIPFGADVISRITACVEGHLEDMRSLLVDSLAGMIDEACAQAGVSRTSVTRMTLAGNTVMEHIAAGIDPTPIGTMPFTPPTLFGTYVDFIEGMPQALFTPCAAGYVGGDIMGGLLAVRMRESEHPMILLDLGTNGEMALGDSSGIVSCATAAGPVFEGANITYGMPAYPGAISQVSYEDGDIKLTVIGDADPIGICGTGLIDAVAMMLDRGVVDGSGLLLDEDEVPEDMARYLVDHDGESAFRLTEGVYITQKDIRCLQLAKSAVCAGIYTMLEERNMEPSDVGSLLIAGGFGVYLNLESASRIGLFPAEMLPVAKSVGNTAIEGATAELVSIDARDEIAAIVEATHYLELSTSATFNSFYVETMMFEE